MGNSQNKAFDAKMKAKEWQWKLRGEVKNLNKEIKKIEADEARLRKEIEVQAAKGNVDCVQMLAKSIVRTRKAVQRLERTKASMHTVDLQLTTSLATMSTVNSLRLSADVMKKVNAIARIPEVGGVMDEMRKEMQRCADAEDGIEEALNEEGENEAAAHEVQKVLEEMALDKMGPLTIAAVAAAPQATPPQAAPPTRQLVAAGAEAGYPQQRAPAPAPPPAPVSSMALGVQPSASIPFGAFGTFGASADASASTSLAPAPSMPMAPMPTMQQEASSSGGARGGGGAGGLDDDELMRRLMNLKK